MGPTDKPSDLGDMIFEEQEPEPVQPCDDRTAEILFKKMIRKFESVRNVSSPVLKLVTIHRLMNEFMTAFHGTANTGPHEADNLIVVIFYILVNL